MELNEQQKKLAETIEGFIVSDAGPGTGKTNTITERYANIVNSGVDSKDILMVTFTKNAAQEIKDRISSKIIETNNREEPSDASSILRNLKVTTFDSLCLNIVLNAPEAVSSFFEFEEILSRNSKIEENDTLNVERFTNFYTRFASKYGSKYIKQKFNPAALSNGRANDIYNLINRLMSRGVIPLKKKWFGNGEKNILGDIESLKDIVLSSNKTKKTLEVIKHSPKYFAPELADWDNGQQINDKIIESVTDDDRSILFEYIHDLYYGYLKECIKTGKLTFSVVEVMAFSSLFQHEGSRKLFGVNYVMIDEFQDTNELQMKICLLLMNKPNLCVVGDWKQGIHGFRYASIDNIIDFKNRVDGFIRELNTNKTRVSFNNTNVTNIPLNKNYRNSRLILDKSFDALKIPAIDNELVSNGKIVELESIMDPVYKKNTAFEMITAKDKELEPWAVVEKIINYVNSRKYLHVDSKTQKERPVTYKDIAVLCRTGQLCAKILKVCNLRSVPAFFQGDIEIMSTREGKLALAWLRYVNNKNDLRGLIAILTDMKYPLSSIVAMIDYSGRPKTYPSPSGVPEFIINQRTKLVSKCRRPNDLLTTIFSFYGLNNDITQSIINAISSIYDNSLVTIPDLIRLIENDIKMGTKYDVEPSLKSEAVTIQTIHKSKGLEYPVVIIAGLDTFSMPSTKSDSSWFKFSDITGIRCTHEYFLKETDGTKREFIYDSWKYAIIHAVIEKDYSEERRLLFVAMTRAKQYLTLIASNPSRFFRYYGSGVPISITGATGGTNNEQSVKAPTIGHYIKRRVDISVHDLMLTIPQPLKESISAISKGVEYGVKVHKAAYLMAHGRKFDDSLPETAIISEILHNLKNANISVEVPCVLPIKNISIKGVIDLMAEYDDRIEIHDYKTDINDNYLEHYKLQVSVYAQVAKFKGKKVDCFIDYLSQNKSVQITPHSMERIEQAVSDYLNLLPCAVGSTVNK
ncbi:MAG: UvrD-helicase domain-containing protein [archaeon]|nr:UvrD-helicase domain-containing protein [archaeon]